MSSGALLLLLCSAGFATAEATSLQWGRPHTVRPPVRVSSRNRQTALVRDSRVVAAVWEEDEAFAVQPAVDRSIVVERVTPVYDPFEEDGRAYPEDRLAELPDDPFDEPVGEPIPVPEPESNLEDVEEAVDDEIRRRQSAEDLLDEEMDASLDEDLLDEDLFEDDAFDDDEMLDLEEEDDDEALDFGLDFGDGDEEDDEEDADDEPTPAELEKQRKELAREQRESEESCRKELAAIESDRISSIDLSIRVEGSAGKDFPYECAVGTKQHESRQWPQVTYNWKAAALCHKPLYFEQVQLERYGHSWGPYVQPLMSGAHFFATLPVLPYKMGIRTPCECVYSLGYYRPGSCAPYMIDPISFTWRAALFEGAAATGISFVIP